jgi:hypothetical protein
LPKVNDDDVVAQAAGYATVTLESNRAMRIRSNRSGVDGLNDPNDVESLQLTSGT